MTQVHTDSKTMEEQRTVRETEPHAEVPGSDFVEGTACTAVYTRSFVLIDLITAVQMV